MLSLASKFPERRMRRWRQTPALRALVRETRLSADQLILPLFVCPGTKVRRPIEPMPGFFQLSVDELVKEAAQAWDSGVRSLILFGLPETKDAVGTGAYAADGIVPRALEALKRELPEMALWADVCLCEYTDHGHCGVLHGHQVANDPTLELLAKSSLAYARAGADIIAPSDMMDGRVAAIRAGLDQNGFENTPIVSYAAKYASAYYGPFRVAADSAPAFGDRRSYQMDPANGDEALNEVALDLREGADAVMVKPALAYLDVIWRVKQAFQVPVAAYQVSGEYAMLHAAAQRGWVDYGRVMRESLLAIRRAGADMILTYHAREAAELLNRGEF